MIQKPIRQAAVIVEFELSKKNASELGLVLYSDYFDSDGRSWVLGTYGPTDKPEDRETRVFVATTLEEINSFLSGLKYGFDNPKPA